MRQGWLKIIDIIIYRPLNEEVECSVDDAKVNDTIKQASLKEVCKLEEATKEGRSETGKNCELKEQPNRAKATSSDEKNVDNQTDVNTPTSTGLLTETVVVLGV